MQGLLAGLSIMAATRGLAVDRHQIELVRPAFCDPGRKAGHEQVRIDPVHHRAQPIGTGNAVVELGKALQKRQVRIAPIDNVVIVIAVRDRPAYNQKQDFTDRRPSRLAAYPSPATSDRAAGAGAASLKTLTNPPSDPPESVGSQRISPSRWMPPPFAPSTGKTR